MTVGQLIGTVTSLDSNSTLTVQPSIGTEWILHNIYTSNTIDLNVVGSSTVSIETDLNESLVGGYFFHANFTHYYQIVNKTSDTIYVGYDGVQSK